LRRDLSLNLKNRTLAELPAAIRLARLKEIFPIAVHFHAPQQQQRFQESKIPSSW
jgi:hypothetical protein